MTEIQEFIAATIRLERNSALRYEELADAISGLGAPEVVGFFRQQALFSRRHMQQAQTWAAFRDTWNGTDRADSPDAARYEDDVEVPSFELTDEEGAETAPIWVADGFSSLEDAMQVALEAEESAHNFYLGVAQSTEDPEVRTMATEFAKEESGHANMVRAMMARVKGK
jgi:rubrerythrin